LFLCGSRDYSLTVGHVLAGFAFVDQFPGMVDLLGRKFHLSAKLHAPALRGLYSAAGAL
jgi:hypothetical protein